MNVDGTNLNFDNITNILTATNIYSTGALTGGGSGHDQFSDFAANEHIDWTNATSAFSTTAAGTALTVKTTTAGGGYVALFKDDQGIDICRIGKDSSDDGYLHIVGAGTARIQLNSDLNTISSFSDATAASSCQLKLENTSTGDAGLQFTAGANWCIGVDNSDNDQWKVCYSNLIGTNDMIVVARTTGDTTFTGKVRSNNKFNVNGTDGFTGTGAYTNFTIVGGIITAAS